jgi:hypothetical protein
MEEDRRKRILAALEICAGQDCYTYDRTECPFWAEDRCVDKLKDEAAELLREDEKVIEELRSENRRLHRENFWLTGGDGWGDGFPRRCAPRNDEGDGLPRACGPRNDGREGDGFPRRAGGPPRNDGGGGNAE